MKMYDLVKQSNPTASAAKTRTEKKIEKFCDSVKGITIDNVEQLDAAVELLRAAKTLETIVTDLTEPFKKLAYGHYKEVQEEQKALLAPVLVIVDELRVTIASFHERASQELIDAAIALERAPTASSVLRFEDHSEQVREAEKAVEYREYFSVEIEDHCKFYDWVFKNDRDDLLLPNGKELNKFARRIGEAFTIPGCKLIRKVTPVVR